MRDPLHVLGAPTAPSPEDLAQLVWEVHEWDCKSTLAYLLTHGLDATVRSCLGEMADAMADLEATGDDCEFPCTALARRRQFDMVAEAGCATEARRLLEADGEDVPENLEYACEQLVALARASGDLRAQRVADLVAEIRSEIWVAA